MESWGDGAAYLLIAVFAAWWFAWRYYQARHAKEMAALLKQAQAKAAAVSQLAFSSQEIFTLDWTNRLLEATWAPALEQILSARLTTTLEAALTRVVQGQTKEGPLRYLERIKVDTVKLGRRPPALSSCTASTDAGSGCVRLALPFTFEPTEGFSVVLALHVKPAKLLPAFATRVALTSFSIKGELLLDFHASPGQAPGISSLGVSFAQPPAIDFNFHTFALAFGDLPFLLDILKDLTQKALNAKMVAPQKLSIDLSQKWEQRSRSSSNSSNVLSVPSASKLIPAENAMEAPAHKMVIAVHAQSWRALWPLGRKAGSPGKATGPSSIPIRAGGLPSNAAAAVKNAEPAKPVSHARAEGSSTILISASAGPTDAADALSFKEAKPVMAVSSPAEAFGAPAVPIRAAEVTKDAAAAAAAYTIPKPGKPAQYASVEAHTATTHEAIEAEAAVKEVQVPRTGSEADEAHPSSSEEAISIAGMDRESVASRLTIGEHASAASIQSLATAWGSIHENGVYLEEHRVIRSTRESRSSLTDELPGSFQLVDTASCIPEDLVQAADGMLAGVQESGRRIPIEQEALAQVASLKANLAAIQKRIAAEQLRALVEGAPFIVHTALGSVPQYLWLRKATHELMCGPERVSEQVLSRDAAGKPKLEAAVALSPASILDIKAGCAAFPKEPSRRSSWIALKGLLGQSRRSSTGSVGKVRVAAVEERRCFSVLAEAQYLHLELPKGGNGRSRREWMDAIAGLDISDVPERPRPDDAKAQPDPANTGTALDGLFSAS